MKAPPPEQAAPAAKPAQKAAAPAKSDQAQPTQGAAAPAAPSGQQTAAAPAQPAEQPAAAGQNSTASGEAVPPQSPNATGSAQDASGQAGPAHAAPEPNSAPAAQGNVQNAPQTSSLSAPVPVEPAETTKESVLSLADAEQLAGANDIAACQEASRKLRLAGIAMPPPLLALTALDLKFQQSEAPQSQPLQQQEQPAPQKPVQQ